MTWLAGLVAGLSFVAYLVALWVGPSCANTASPYCALAFFGSWLWLGYLHERGRNGR